MTQLKTLLTTGEVAAAVGMNPATIRRWADDGRIDYVQLPSRQRRYHADVVDAILRQIKTTATTGATP